MFSQIITSNPFDDEYRMITKQTKEIHKKSNLVLMEDNNNFNELKDQIICNTGLSLVKSLIEYIKLLYIIRPCKDLIIEYMKKICEYYVYCVFLLFLPVSYKQTILQNYPLEYPVDYSKVFNMFRIKENCKELRKYLFKVHSDLKHECEKNEEDKAIIKALLGPKLNSKINLEDTSTLNGIYEKVVAIESCYYIFNSFRGMQNSILVSY